MTTTPHETIKYVLETLLAAQKTNNTIPPAQLNDRIIGLRSMVNTTPHETKNEPYTLEDLREYIIWSADQLGVSDQEQLALLDVKMVSVEEWMQRWYINIEPYVDFLIERVQINAVAARLAGKDEK